MLLALKSCSYYLCASEEINFSLQLSGFSEPVPTAALSFLSLDVKPDVHCAVVGSCIFLRLYCVVNSLMLFPLKRIVRSGWLSAIL